jgi:hypothetical protein
MEEDRKTLEDNLGCFCGVAQCYIFFGSNIEYDIDDEDERAAIRTGLSSLPGTEATPPPSPHRELSPQILPPSPNTRKIDSSTRSRSQLSQKDVIFCKITT